MGTQDFGSARGLPLPGWEVSMPDHDQDTWVNLMFTELEESLRDCEVLDLEEE